MSHHDYDVWDVFDDGVAFPVVLRELFAAIDRVGIPKPSTMFTSYPRWVSVSFAVAGEDGLCWAARASEAERDEFRAVVGSAMRLGGLAAARGAAQAFVAWAQGSGA